MPQISPFVGLLFDRSRVGPLEGVTAPPYDTIGPEDQRRLLDASPYNIVRIDLGEATPADVEAGNKYMRASSALGRWREEGMLLRTPRPSYFPYEMRFSFRGRERCIRGLICEVELEQFGGSIIPHEHTMAGPVEDRLLLMRAARANLSPVYAVFSARCRPLEQLLSDVVQEVPAADMTDEDGVVHRMWVVEDGREIAGCLADRPLLIADGHHRYTTALKYRDEMRDREGPGPWDRVMMLVVDAVTEDPPVLPIHRLLVTGAAPPGGTRVPSLEDLLAEVDDDRLVYGIVAREEDGIVHRVAELDGYPPAVAELHRQVLGGIESSKLEYTPDAVAAEDAVLRGEARAALFLPPTTVERIVAATHRGERLPQKSTYFWPKPRTGMVIRPLE